MDRSLVACLLPIFYHQYYDIMRRYSTKGQGHVMTDCHGDFPLIPVVMAATNPSVTGMRTSDYEWSAGMWSRHLDDIPAISQLAVGRITNRGVSVCPQIGFKISMNHVLIDQMNWFDSLTLAVGGSRCNVLQGFQTDTVRIEMGSRRTIQQSNPQQLYRPRSVISNE
jgi:hypothetical protein